MPRVSTKKISDEKSVAKSAPVKKIRLKKTISKTTKANDKLHKTSLIDLKPTKDSRSRKVKRNDDLIEILLPKEPPVRLLNKINYLNYISHPKTAKAMAGVASFSGYTFIVVGLYLSFVVADIKTNQTHNLLATTVCSDDSCIDTSSYETTDTSSSDTSSILALDEKIVPTIVFPTDFPKEPKDDFIFTLEITDVTDVKLFIFSDTTGEQIALSLKDKEGDRYSFYVPYDILKSSNYTFKLKTLSVDKSSYYFTGPEFTVHKDDSVKEVETLAYEDESSALITHEPHLKLENIADGKYKFVTLNAADYLRVEIYALPNLSATPIFLGKAVLKGDVWIYFLDGSTLPVNTYNVFAKAVKPDSTHKTKPISITIRKIEIETTEDEVTTDAEIVNPLILTEKVKETAEELSETEDPENNILEQRHEYYQKENVDEKSSVEITTEISNNETNLGPANFSVEQQAEKEAERLLDEISNDLNILLQKYASSLQGGDQNIERLALSELHELRDSLIMKVKIDTGTKDISEQIALILNTKFETLQERVIKYENLLKERSQLISKDTDEDGITDFDEVNLYKTNSNSPDTDGDGVIDSIEITKGFDPLSSNNEAVVSFQSPKEVNYTDEKNLVIESITPAIVIDDSNEKALMAEIRGKALPNSFVTLFIYSSPTIVTVKADSDGNFVYTLEKELEEGEHEIYVAMTDNTGSIVARSKPFQFVKTAEAFTPVDAENQAIVQTNDIYQDTELNSYNTVAAMGVISFGLILLMLGHTLRNRPEEDIKQHDSDS